MRHIRCMVRGMGFFTVVCMWLTMAVSQAGAVEVLRISSSAQVYDAYAKDALAAFQQKDGSRVEVFVSSSASSLARLMNGMADLATTVEGFNFRYGEFGYLQIPFCQDPLVVITNPVVEVDGITDEQVEGIFSGQMTNWKGLGGPDERIIVVVPGTDTAAYRNFDRQAMRGEKIFYDFISYRSTMAVRAIERVPYSISFIGQGVVANQPGIKTLKINGRKPGEADYPYHQVLSFAVEGNPAGVAARFIDFTFSEKGQAIIKGKNMTPIPR